MASVLMFPVPHVGANPAERIALRIIIDGRIVASSILRADVAYYVEYAQRHRLGITLEGEA